MSINEHNFFNSYLERRGGNKIDKRILIVGGAGYIGTVLTDNFLKNGYRVRSFDLLLYQNNECVLDYIGDSKYEFVYGDIADRKVLERVLNGIDCVILLAGLVGDPITKKYPEESGLINDLGVKTVIDACSQSNIDRLIFVSTCSNYGLIETNEKANEDLVMKPLSLYAKYKVAVEEYILSLKGKVNLSCFNLEIPGDPSSAAPFIVLTLLTAGSKLLIKNINCNPTRMGFVKILKKMNANITIKNLKKKSGEPVGDIFVKSSFLKPINCPKELVPSLIDEFPLLFVIASVIKGVTKFSGINELRHKESDRIKNMEIGLNQIGIKTKSTINSLKIYGNPNIQMNKTLRIFSKKDHRIAMSFFCLGQLLSGDVEINNFETVNTSFSKFLVIMKKIGAKFEIKK